MERTIADYWRDVRSLPVFQIGGENVVDWASKFPGQIPRTTNQPGSAMYRLGFDPLKTDVQSDGEKLIDPAAATGPMPDWANASIADRIGVLEDQMASVLGGNKAVKVKK